MSGNRTFHKTLDISTGVLTRALLCDMVQTMANTPTYDTIMFHTSQPFAYALWSKSTDQCIYVGSTCNISRRLCSHVYRFKWDLVWLLKFEDRNEALLQEYKWIQELKPLHNSAEKVNLEWKVLLSNLNQKGGDYR